MSNRVSAQNIITSIVGNSAIGGTYSGDGGQATAAGIDYFFGLRLDGSGNIYFSDPNFNVIRKIDHSTGIINVYAGQFGTTGYSGDGGPASAAKFNQTYLICTDASDNLYIADNGNSVIRKIDHSTGIISTVAGNHSLCCYALSGDGGPATAAGLGEVLGVFVDGPGNLYITEYGHNVVRKVDATTHIITRIAGTSSTSGGYSGDGGPATAALLSGPDGVFVDGAGNVYITEVYNSVVRKVSTLGIISTVAGKHAIGGTYSGDGGPATAAALNAPYTSYVDGSGNIFIADNGNNVVRMVNTAGIISTVAGNNSASLQGNGGPATAADINPIDITFDGSGNMILLDGFFYVVDKVTPPFGSGGSSTPSFTGGTTLTVCQNASATSINSLLSVTDATGSGTVETYSVSSTPAHGSIGGLPTTATISSGSATPTGVTYTPTTSYSGTDAFTITVNNGTNSATHTVNVTVNATPAAITNNVPFQVNTYLPLASATSGGTWTSASTGVATIGSTGGVLGVGAGTSLISYTVSGCAATATVTVNAAGALKWYSMTSGGDASSFANWWSINNNTGYQPTVFSTTNTIWVFQSNMTSTAALTFVGNVSIISGGTFTPQSGSTTTVGGNWLNTGGTFVANAGTVLFNGANSASADTLSGTMTGSSAFNNLSFSSPANSYTFLNNPADVNGDFVQSSGDITAPSGNLSVTGNFNHSGGTFAPNGGTLIKKGTSTTLTVTAMTTPGTNCLNNLTFNASSAATYTISSDLVLTGSFVNLNANATMALGNHTLTVGRNWSNPGPFTTGAGHSIIYNGTGSPISISGNQ